MDQKSANSVDSIIYVISAFISPVLGILVDYTGRNLFWVLVAILITQVSHKISEIIACFWPFSPGGSRDAGFHLYQSTRWNVHHGCWLFNFGLCPVAYGLTGYSNASTGHCLRHHAVSAKLWLGLRRPSCRIHCWSQRQYCLGNLFSWLDIS